MSSPPVVYLDTQDYSRFGDVLRGKADAATEALFTELESRKRSGDVIFAISMPILGELLQYDASFRDTTLKKAEAVERLCGVWALAFPSRLVAAQIAETAMRLGLLAGSVDIRVLSSDRYWYPNIADSFDGLKTQLVQGLDAKIAALGLPSRAQRRRLTKAARKIDLYKAASDAAPEIAAKFGLPIDAITGSIVAFLKGSISSENASRRLFSSIAAPTRFVEIYFEKVQSDHSLPGWIRKTGDDLHASLVEFRTKLRPFVDLHSTRPEVAKLLAESKASFGRAILRLADEDIHEFGVDMILRQHFSAEPVLAAQVPACVIVGAVVEAYARQILGLSGTESKIERSFGGDLVHALYLPHVDLWRGDRRFSAVLRRAVPLYAERVVPALQDLPVLIDTWHGTRHSSIVQD